LNIGRISGTTVYCEVPRSYRFCIGWVMKELGNQLTGELDAMWRFALRLTANQSDAEDLVQRTCVKALENQERYENQGRLRSWLFRIEHRIWLNVLRSRQIRSAGTFAHSNAYLDGDSDNNANRTQIVFDPDASNSSREPINTQSPESHLQLYQIMQQVESLPEAQRLVLVLVCVEGFTYNETANILDIPVGTVMSRLARARMTLGKIMLNANDSKVGVTVETGLS